jgi:hypothetical protein
MANSPQPKTWRDTLPIHPAAELFRLMEEPELREVGEDIKARGLKSPVAVWKGQLIDGRNRLDAMELVGIKFEIGGHGPNYLYLKSDDPALTILTGDRAFIDDVSGFDPYDYVLSANIHRRHLTAEDKRDLIAKVLKAKPEASNATVAKQVKADDKTVAKVRRKLESTSEIPKLKKTVGADGKSRPKTQKSAPKSQRRSVSAKDIALEDFSARAMELIRLTRNKSAERFAKTALSDDNIRHLAKFFADLCKIRQDSGITRQSAEVSTEQRRAEHAALDGASP